VSIHYLDPLTQPPRDAYGLCRAFIVAFISCQTLNPGHAFNGCLAGPFGRMISLAVPVRPRPARCFIWMPIQQTTAIRNYSAIPTGILRSS
jgi:hypothetical protein